MARGHCSVDIQEGRYFITILYYCKAVNKNCKKQKNTTIFTITILMLITSGVIWGLCSVDLQEGRYTITIFIIVKQ